ncbi:hypothetical protein LJR245_000876 [Rhizobium leguminosarum]
MRFGPGVTSDVWDDDIPVSAIDDAQGRCFMLREGVVLSGERNRRTLRRV